MSIMVDTRSQTDSELEQNWIPFGAGERRECHFQILPEPSAPFPCHAICLEKKTERALFKKMFHPSNKKSLPTQPELEWYFRSRTPGLGYSVLAGRDPLYSVRELFFLSFAFHYVSVKVLYWHWDWRPCDFIFLQYGINFHQEKKKKVVNGNQALKVIRGTEFCLRAKHKGLIFLEFSR